MSRLKSLLTVVAGTLVIAGSAQAQDGTIWVHCEPAPGERADGIAIRGTMQVGNGIWRRYDPSTQSLGSNDCAESRCVLTPDEFTYRYSPPTHTISAVIDRRTGRASQTLDYPESAHNGTAYSQCRGVTDPRPDVQF